MPQVALRAKSGERRSQRAERRRPHTAGITQDVLRQGPIPRFAHSVLEYLAGIFLVVAPFLFNYKSGSTAVSIIAGGLLIFLPAGHHNPPRVGPPGPGRR